MSSVINDTLLAIKSVFEAGVNIFNGGTAVSSNNPLPVGDRFLNVGYDHDGVADGYINDLRISDIAVYTANFTPPSTPF